MSDATPILHMFSPQKHMSPFDVNMAADAGYKVIVPYINVTLEEVTPLVQDAIFSRPPEYGKRTGVFIGATGLGWQRDAGLRLDHLLLSPNLHDRLVAAGVDREVRAMPDASDHAPVWVTLSE